jgi:hypothetical protein
MSAAREEVLGRIRAALAEAPAPAEVPRAYRRTATYSAWCATTPA